MYDLFYIVEVKPQWYNLLINDLHYCIGCGNDLDVLKRTIYLYVRKYKTVERVLRAIENTSCRGVVAKTTKTKRQEDYDSGLYLPFEDLVREAVAWGLKDNRQDTPFNRIKNKVKTTPLGVVENSTKETTPPKRVVGKITRPKIKRTTTK